MDDILSRIKKRVEVEGREDSCYVPLTSGFFLDFLDLGDVVLIPKNVSNAYFSDDLLNVVGDSIKNTKFWRHCLNASYFDSNSKFINYPFFCIHEDEKCNPSPIAKFLGRFEEELSNKLNGFDWNKSKSRIFDTSSKFLYSYVISKPFVYGGKEFTITCHVFDLKTKKFAPLVTYNFNQDDDILNSLDFFIGKTFYSDEAKNFLLESVFRLNIVSWVQFLYKKSMIYI